MTNTPEEETLEAAIQAQFAAENDGAMLTGYFLVMKGKRVEDLENQNTRYATLTPDHLEYDQALGLARYGVLQVENGFMEDES